MYSCIIHKVSLQSCLPSVKNSHTLWHPETLPSTGWGYWAVLLGHMAFDPFRKWAQSTWVSHVDTSSDPSDDFSTLENPILCQNTSMQWTNKAANKWGIWSILLKLSEWASAPLFSSKVGSALTEREAPYWSCWAAEGTELRGRFVQSKKVRKVKGYS